MSRCDYCESRILFGGKRKGDQRFCNARCSAQGATIALSRQIPDHLISEALLRTHQGLCRKCGGSGPVDVHVHHQIWSAILLTSWKSTPQISCRDCGRKSQLGDAALSLIFGWWGFPWGLVLTPVQVGRNVFGMLRGPDSTKPSKQLEKMIRMHVALQTKSKGQDMTPQAQ